jgi:hypothetical protein
MMAMIAAASVLGISALRYLSRPYPTITTLTGPIHVLVWTDGSCTSGESGKVPGGFDHHGPIVRVRWSDGSSTFHLRQTPARPGAGPSNR